MPLAPCLTCRIATSWRAHGASSTFRSPTDIAQRAIEVQGLPAVRFQHRSVSTLDLLIAATAERYSLTVLHYDGDYDRIAQVTGQPVEWVVPAERATSGRLAQLPGDDLHR